MKERAVRSRRTPDARATAITLAAFAGLLALLIVPYFSSAANFLVREGTLAPLHAAVQDATLWLVSVLFESLGGQRLWVVQGTDGYPTIETAGFVVRVAPSCAGYLGVVASTGFLVALVWAHRARLDPRRCALVVAGAGVLVFLLNAVRIAALLYIGSHGAPDIAVEGFHSNFGAVALLAVVGGAAAMMRLPWFGARRHPVSPVADEESVGDDPDTARFGAYLALTRPLAIVLAVLFVLGLGAGAVNWLYPVPMALGLVLLAPRWREWRTLLGAAGRGLPVAVGVGCYGLWIALVPRDAEREAAMRDALHAAPVALSALWCAARMLGSTFVTPLLEELAFRGGIAPAIRDALAGRLGARLALAAAIVGSAALFGLIHHDMLAAALVGIAYAGVRFARPGLGGAIVAHAITNGLVGLHVLLAGSWSYW
ncbi:CAAX prenyl protease-related protein [Sphingomonas sp. CJ20]